MPTLERLTDDQWQVTKEFLPIGRKRRHDLRNIFDAILHVTRTGMQWRNLGSDFPAWSAVYHYFFKWSRDGTIERINTALNMLDREAEGRAAEPSLVIVDSQSVKLAATIFEERGTDGNKKVNGRKRQILTDTGGRIWQVAAHAANIHDGEGGVVLLEGMCDYAGRLEKILGDSAYRGAFARACEAMGLAFEVPERPQGTTGFVVVAKRWVVERSFAWLGFFRRLSVDREYTTKSSATYVYLANIALMLKRLGKAK